VHTLEQSHWFVQPVVKVMWRNHMANTVQMMNSYRKREYNNCINLAGSWTPNLLLTTTISIIQNKAIPYGQNSFLWDKTTYPLINVPKSTPSVSYKKQFSCTFEWIRWSMVWERLQWPAATILCKIIYSYYLSGFNRKKNQ